MSLTSFLHAIVHRWVDFSGIALMKPRAEDVALQYAVNVSSLPHVTLYLDSQVARAYFTFNSQVGM